MGQPEIADTLRLFNRKERHLVIQNCLGDAARTLSRRFREDVRTTLGSRLKSCIRPDAWWATDYHLDWLLGALVWHTEAGRCDRDRPRDNERQLIRGNQEDIDLIIASGSDVILLEAKGHDAWTNSQLTSKITRLNMLCDSATGIVRPEFSSHSVTLHLVLMSIREPSKVICNEWPAWAKTEDRPYWMGLDADNDLIRIERCDKEGGADANGGHWRFIRSSQKAILPPV
jgi:hypothetical protein